MSAPVGAFEDALANTLPAEEAVMRVTRQVSLLVALSTAMLLSLSNAQGAVILSPVSATASSEHSTFFDIGNTIDQSGLSASFISGVSSFDLYLSFNFGAGFPTHAPAEANAEWATPVGVRSATINYDLGAALVFDRMALWNEDISGIGFFDLFVSLDNQSFVQLADNVRPINNRRDERYRAQVFDFGIQTARYVRMEVGDCPQSILGTGPAYDGCQMGEIAFSIVGTAQSVPEPATIALLGVGLAGLGFSRRKRFVS